MHSRRLGSNQLSKPVRPSRTTIHFMSLLNSLPGRIAAAPDVQALEACAQTHSTPCGAGSVIWHIWGQGPPLLLLHGGSGSWTHWVRNIESLLQAGYQVLVPDLPGCGDSASLPSGHDADAIAPWIASGLDALIGDRACDIVAFSFGALVAGFLAATHPARVRKLVLVAPPGLSAIPGPSLALRDWQAEAPGPLRLAAQRHNLLTLMISREGAGTDLAVQLHAANVERDRLRKRRLFRTDILLRTLPAVACDVWGIWGASDVLFRDRLNMLCPALSQAPGFRFLTLIPDAGHWVQYEQAARFNDAVISMLGLPPQSQTAG